MNTQKRKFFLDMDEVVADWMGAAQNLLHRNFHQDEILPTHEWEIIRDTTRFYRDLTVLPGAVELVDWATGYAKQHNMDLAFLTAIPHTGDMPYVYYDKIQWAQKNFPGIPVLFGPHSAQKHMHCSPGDILIDDRIANCQEWREARGIAHQYTTWQKCQEWITEFTRNQS